MRSTPSAEHFVTLFDSSFLPQGLALATSLAVHSSSSTLWVLCVDRDVEAALSRLAFPNVRTIPLRDIEDERLLKVKPARTRREYCWTLGAFTFDAVFRACRDAARVTYLDSDVFFFRSPDAIFEELDSAGAPVLVTEHNFDPGYDKSSFVGRFCVQFLSMDRSAEASQVRRWWQERVLEWCYDRIEPDRFGDQKYLDRWPQLFGKWVHVLARKELALAPWNARMEAARTADGLAPVFYHFHSFRIVGRSRARSVEGGYAIPLAARWLYTSYAAAISGAIQQMRSLGIVPAVQPLARRSFARLRHIGKRVLGRADAYMRL